LDSLSGIDASSYPKTTLSLTDGLLLRTALLFKTAGALARPWQLLGTPAEQSPCNETRLRLMS
jgi:hypothetical protein